MAGGMGMDMEHRSGSPSILACIGEGAGSQDVIRRAAQVAVELGAELLALHVEPPGARTRRAPAASAQLERNLRLARDLGAYIEVIDSHQVVDSIVRFARDHGVQRIIIGQPRTGGWVRRLRGDIVTRLRRAVSVVIDVVPGAPM